MRHRTVGTSVTKGPARAVFPHTVSQSYLHSRESLQLPVKF